MSTPGAAAPLRFGRFELQPDQRRLLVDGAPAPLGGRAFDLLVALAERPGQLVGKHALMDLVWPGLVVQENNLAAQASALRKVLGGDVIATIPGRGYRFVAPLAPDAKAPAPSPRSPSAGAASDAAATAGAGAANQPARRAAAAARAATTTCACSRRSSTGTAWSPSSVPAAWASRCSRSTCSPRGATRRIRKACAGSS
jgi:DNA-binding winged helix-turn-helix (wHTH) protein